MKANSLNSVAGAEVLYIALFDALSSSSYLFKNDAPRYTILAATPYILKFSGLQKEDVIGKGLFEVFPSNPHDPRDTGQRNLMASLNQVLQTKKPHQLPVQRYDIPDEHGRYIERYWCAENRPVFGPDGEVAFIVHTAEDITDRIKAREREVQLEGIEKVFSLFMHAPIVIGLANGENYVLEMANEEAFKLWGKDPEEIIGKPILEGLPELAGQGIIELFDQVRTSGQPFIVHEVPVKSFKNGLEEQHYFNLVYQPYYANDSSLATGVFTISHDITEQVLARRRVEESEERFRVLADASPILIWMLNPDGSYGYVNKTTLDFLGITQEEIAAVGWEPFQHPDDLVTAVPALTEAIQNRKRFEIEHRMRCKNGEYRWMLSQAMPAFDGNGNVLAYVGSSIDFNEAKKSRQDLQTALEQARLSKAAAELGTFDMDLEKGGMHWDDRCRILFGISHNKPVTYERDFVEGLHPDDRERILKIIDRVFVKSLSNGDYDVEYRTVGAEDGIVRWVRAKGKVYFDGNDKPVRFIGSVLDITEKVNAIQKIESLVEERTKELEQAYKALLISNQELKRSNHNLEEFTRAASHDMKEPIRKVLTFSDRLRRSLEPRMTESEKGLFDRVENATQRMGLLVDDLLEFSHVSERPLEKEDVDLNAIMDNVLLDLELQVDEKKARIKVHDLPSVKGYKRQLQQLFQNLVSNALKYNKPGIAPVVAINSQIVTGRDVEDNVLPEQAAQPFYLIEVHDNGIGFEQEYAERIFGMFQRLHGKAAYPGTGVGLSITRKVIENHNGYIWAESQPNVGTTFKVLLPHSS